MGWKKKTSSKSGSRIFKWVVITGGLLLVVVFMAAFLVIVGIKNWLRSDAFRELVETKASETLKSEVTLKSLSWDGKSEVYSDGMEAYGYEDSSISVLRAEGVRAEFGKVTGVLEIPEVSADRFYVEFSPEKKSGLFERSEAGLKSASVTGKATSSAPGWLSSLVPKRAEIGEVLLSQVGLRVKNESGVDTVLLRDTGLVMIPMETGSLEAWDIEGLGGKLVIGEAPPLGLDRYSLRWRGSDLFLTDSAADIYEEGRLTAKGEIGFGDDGVVDLDLQLSNVGVKEVLDPVWEKKLRGTLGGDFAVVGTTDALVQSGTLRLTDGQITAIPVLNTIAKYTKIERFKTLVLQQAQTDFVKNGERIELSNLAIQSDGLCRVEGTAVLSGGMIEGNFRVGVNPGTLRWIPGAERKVFTESDGGFLWTDVQVTGPADSPKEDLSGRLISGAIESLVEDVPSEAIDRAREILKGPAGTPSSLINDGKKVIESLVPLLGN